MFSIEKDVWDVIHLERIETSSDPAKKVLLLLTLLLTLLLLMVMMLLLMGDQLLLPCTSPRTTEFTLYQRNAYVLDSKQLFQVDVPQHD